ncbi:hypothetical protein ABW20_dc0106532 [Dactylellina cionopaga]|nr:hypothetical protein ABW20_dc0106532 [Dactylellina cionopaga]
MKLHLLVSQLGLEIGLQSIITIIILTLLGYFLANSVYQVYFSPLSKIPGPWYASISRLWLGSRALRGRLIFDVHALHERYGPYVRVSQTEVSVADVDSLRKIHSTNDIYVKSSWYKALGDDFGIVCITDHDSYKSRRKAYGNAFSISNLRLLEPVIQKHVDRCIERIKREIDGEGTPDVMMWTKLMSADIIGEISYGLDFKMLENEKFDPFVQNVTGVFVLLAMRGQLQIIRLLEPIISRIPHPAVQWFFGCERRLSEFSTNALTNLKREIQGCKDGAERPTLFSKILDRMDNPNLKHTLTMEEIKGEALISNITGSHTIPSTVTFIIWEIFRNEEVRRKLEQELDKYDIINQEILDEKLQELPYFKLVLKEGLRIYASAQALIPRTVPKGGRQLGAHFFDEGTVLLSSIYTAHRDPNIFPEPYL